MTGMPKVDSALFRALRSHNAPTFRTPVEFKLHFVLHVRRDKKSNPQLQRGRTFCAVIKKQRELRIGHTAVWGYA